MLSRRATSRSRMTETMMIRTIQMMTQTQRMMMKVKVRSRVLRLSSEAGTKRAREVEATATPREAWLSMKRKMV